MIVRATGRSSGRRTEVSPETSALRYLSYRRTRLAADVRAVDGESAGEELALFVLKGKARVTVDGEAFDLGWRDGLYVPPGSDFRIERTNGEVDIAEAAATAETGGPAKKVSYESARGDPALCLHAGKESYERDVVKLIDTNIDASRLLCGYTLGKPANWTSWCPHEHAAAREEIYLYIDMPRPAFGLQMIYEDLDNPETVAAVFEDDAAVITRGYHPNTGIPGFGINFLWMMAGLNGRQDRDWGAMNDDPAFAGRY